MFSKHAVIFDHFVCVRLTLEKYSAATMNIVERLLPIIAKNLGLQPEALTDKFTGGIQSVRMNYYPPCAQATNVIGLSPHSDAGFLTVVLQVNQVQGLQIRNNGAWVPVMPLDGAFVVNVGDTFEVCTALMTLVSVAMFFLLNEFWWPC